MPWDSLVTYLEDAVAQLELERDSLTVRGDSGAIVFQSAQDHATIPPQSSITSSFVDVAAAYRLAARTAIESAPASTLHNAPRFALPYYRTFFLGAELPFPLAFQEQRTINIPGSHDVASSIQLPEEVADQLMTVYVERILPRYPLFLKQDIHSLFRRFRLVQAGGSPDALPPGDKFLIYMIMAVATLTSKTKDYRKLVSVAESFRREAFNRFDFGLSITKPCTTTIQQLLLLAQYGYLLPVSTNLWQVVGDATRVALEFGLHQHISGESGLDEDALASRRRLFWTVSQAWPSLSCVARPANDHQSYMPWRDRWPSRLTGPLQLLEIKCTCLSPHTTTQPLRF